MAAAIATPKIENAWQSDWLAILRMVWVAVDMVLFLVVAGGGRCRLMTNEEMHLPCQTEGGFSRLVVSLCEALT
jgi:hypothetical protein